MKQSPIIKELREGIKKILEDHEGWYFSEDPIKHCTDKLLPLFQSYLDKCVGKDESVNNYKVCGDVFGDVRDVLRAEIRERGGIK